jgi:hypothetical protein
MSGMDSCIMGNETCFRDIREEKVFRILCMTSTEEMRAFRDGKILI